MGWVLAISRCHPTQKEQLEGNKLIINIIITLKCRKDLQINGRVGFPNLKNLFTVDRRGLVGQRFRLSSLLCVCYCNCNLKSLFISRRLGNNNFP